MLNASLDPQGRLFPKGLKKGRSRGDCFLARITRKYTEKFHLNCRGAPPCAPEMDAYCDKETGAHRGTPLHVNRPQTCYNSAPW